MRKAEEPRPRAGDPYAGLDGVDDPAYVAGGSLSLDRQSDVAGWLEASFLDQLPAAVVVVDDGGDVVYWNGEASRLFGHRVGEVVGRRVADVAVWPLGLMSEQGAVAMPGSRWDGEYDARRADGTSVPVRSVLQRISGPAGFRGVAGSSIDISQWRALELDLARHALRALAGVSSREVFLEHLGRALARDARSGSRTAVLLADLDDFASLNDRLGHDHADDVLRSVAQRIAAVVRAGDVVARTGGDEFAICCESLAGDEEAIGVAQRIVDALGSPFSGIADLLGTVSVSVGVATAVTGADPETLLRQAGIALHHAKERGRGQVQVFDEEVHRYPRSDQIAGDLEGAVAHGDIDVAYQPEYLIGTDELFGFEALARWTHPEWGPVPPGDFIRAAELNGTIGELGAQVLAIACGVLASWVADGARSVRMTVNVSALQLADPAFVDVVRQVLESTRVPPQLLCLEITESALASADVAARALGRLKALGVETSIDDFGTEYSSLSRLQQFPIDYLKINRGFVSGMTDRPVYAAIIDALLGLARSLGIRAVAKGVETQVQLAALKAAGCELGQGFLWSKPLPAAEATRLVEQARRSGLARLGPHSHGRSS